MPHVFLWQLGIFNCNVQSKLNDTFDRGYCRRLLPRAWLLRAKIDHRVKPYRAPQHNLLHPVLLDYLETTKRSPLRYVKKDINIIEGLEAIFPLSLFMETLIFVILGMIMNSCVFFRIIVKFQISVQNIAEA